MQGYRTTHWKRDWAGHYHNKRTGWIVRKSLHGHWDLVDPQTGKTFDTADTKSTACYRADNYAASNKQSWIFK